MERRNKYKVKIDNIWRENERLIKLVSMAALVGVLVAGINIYTHDRGLVEYRLEEPVTVNVTNPHNFSFDLNNPAIASGTKIELEFNQTINANNPMIITVNGQQVAEVTNQQAEVSIDREVLQEQNNVLISREDFGFTQQQILKATLKSTTSLQELQFIFLNFAAILLIFLPIGVVKYREYQKKQMMEEEFPEFLRDIIQGTRAGMSLPQAIRNTESGSYGALDEKISKMSAQIEWGVPFDEVLTEFGKETGSATVQRSVDTIIQAYDSGGNIQDVLESVSDNIRSLRQLREERQSQLYGEMVTGYIVYFIFIGILVALTTYLLPNLANASSSLGGSLSFFGGGGGASLEQNIALYRQWFTRLVYIQAIFSGLIIGKLAEGEMKAGFKHVAILFASGYLATTIFL